MTDQDYLGTSRRSRLTADVTILMLKGGAYAALFCFAILIAAWILLFVSAILPEDSKFAPDPNASLEQALPPHIA